MRPWWMIGALGACRSPEICTLEGEPCELSSAVLERGPRAPGSAFDDWDDVRVEFGGAWRERPLCVVLEGVAWPGVDTFELVSLGELPLTGEPGLLVGWVFRSRCSDTADATPHWRLTGGELQVLEDGPWMHAAVGRWEEGALVGEIRGPGSGP